MSRVLVFSFFALVSLAGSLPAQEKPVAKPSSESPSHPSAAKPSPAKPTTTSPNEKDRPAKPPNPRPANLKPAPEKKSAAKKSAAETSGAKAPAAQDQAEGTDTRNAFPVRQEHVIYLPYEDLREAMGNKDSSIVLPYSQFLEMWQQLSQPVTPPPSPPVNGVITRADYVGSVVGDLVELEVSFDIEVLSADWAQLPVQFGDAAIRSTSADNESVLLRGIGEGKYELLVKGKGKHEVKLTLVAGIRSDVEGRGFVMQCPAVGVSRLELTIPEKDLMVQVAPRQTSELEATPSGPTRIRAVLGSTDQFTVNWQPKSGSAEQTVGLANVTETIAVDVGDGVVHTHAMLDYQILRGSLDALTIEVPTDQRLLDVQAPGLRDWQTEKTEDLQRVHVRLYAPATNEVRLELRMETATPESEFQVGQVLAVGVARESGIVSVRSADDVELQYRMRESIRRVDVAEVPESLHVPGSVYYKFFTPDHRLTLLATRRTPRISVDSHLSVVLEKARVTTRGAFRCQVTGAGIFSLAFRLPEGFQVDDVVTESMERFEVTSAEGGPTLTIYFAQKVLGEFAVDVTASQARDHPAGELPLPLLEPLDTTREQGLVAVIAPESLEVKTESAQMQAARAATPAELVARGFQPPVREGATLAAAFSFVTRPVRIVQKIAERPRRMFAEVTTNANVREDVVQVTTTFRYHIQFAGTDTFRIAVPAAVSDRLQVEGNGIKERRKSATPMEDGSIEWTIVLHSEALGQRSFQATYDCRLSVPEAGTQFEWQPIKVLDADRTSGEVALHKERALSIDASPTGLEVVDPRELTQSVGPTQPYLAYRYFEHPARLLLEVTKHELQDVVKTVVRRAYIEAVVTKDGPMTVRARYDLKSSERQRLAITLHNPRILGMTVAGQTVAPEIAPNSPENDAEDKTYFINVARPSGSDEPFQIATVFETPLENERLGTSDQLHLVLPRFDEGVKFQKVYVRLWVPRDYRLVGSPDGFLSHIGVGLWDARKIQYTVDNPDSWFPNDATSFDFQVGGTTYLFSSLTGPTALDMDYWYIPAMTLLASLAALVLGVVLLRFSLETKVLVAFAVVLAVLFGGLFRPSVVNSWLLSARLGIACVIAMWTVAWLLRSHHRGLFQQWRSWAQPRRPGAAIPNTQRQDSARPDEETHASPADPGPDPSPDGTPTEASEEASDEKSDKPSDDALGDLGIEWGTE